MAFARFHPVVRSGSRPRSARRRRRSSAAGRRSRAGRHTLIAAPTGSGKTLAAFLTAIDDLVDEGLAPAAARRSPRRLRLAAQGAERRHPQEPRRAAARIRAGAEAAGLRAAAHHGGRAHRRHDGGRAGGDAAHAAAHPGHDARVALPAADGRAQPRDAAHGAHGDRRRDPRGHRHAARRAPGAVARAAGSRWPAQPLLRIGLSATQKPIEEVARFLVGAGDARQLRRSSTKAIGAADRPRRSSCPARRSTR